MKRLFLLIGPSGVGKSTASDLVQTPGILKFNLDKEIARLNNVSSASQLLPEVGNEKFFRISTKAIMKLMSNHEDKILLVDVGAGSIHWEGSDLSHLDCSTISLTGKPDVVYSRIKSRTGEQRSPEDYCESEFSVHRMKLYERADRQIDTTNLSPLQVAYEIERFIKQ